jgi:hypothetical protein
VDPRDERRIARFFPLPHLPDPKASQSTRRVHLSSIYAKAAVAGQLDLVRLLFAAEPDKPPRLAG